MSAIEAIKDKLTKYIKKDSTIYFEIKTKDPIDEQKRVFDNFFINTVNFSFKEIFNFEKTFDCPVFFYYNNDVPFVAFSGILIDNPAQNDLLNWIDFYSQYRVSRSVDNKSIIKIHFNENNFFEGKIINTKISKNETNANTASFTFAFIVYKMFYDGKIFNIWRELENKTYSINLVGNKYTLQGNEGKKKEAGETGRAGEASGRPGGAVETTEKKDSNNIVNDFFDNVVKNLSEIFDNVSRATNVLKVAYEKDNQQKENKKNKLIESYVFTAVEYFAAIENHKKNIKELENNPAISQDGIETEGSLSTGDKKRIRARYEEYLNEIKESYGLKAIKIYTDLVILIGQEETYEIISKKIPVALRNTQQVEEWKNLLAKYKIILEPNKPVKK